jgi:dihydropteroate synthase
MGILNTTPDSFYAGSRHVHIDSIIQAAGKMIEDGATLLDLGGQSTRPGSVKTTAEEEIRRVLPAIEVIRDQFPDVFISIDTYQSEVAKRGIKAGADIVNDISAGMLDEGMLKTVADGGVPIIAMHMKGNPQNMQGNTSYHQLLPEMLDYFTDRISHIQRAGIKDIIIDPGFGFSKTLEQNFELLNRLDLLKILNRPVMAGLSRKSMIYKTLQSTPEEALNGTTVLHTVALMKGAQILRVHDVKEASECIRLLKMLDMAG